MAMRGLVSLSLLLLQPPTARSCVKQGHLSLVFNISARHNLESLEKTQGAAREGSRKSRAPGRKELGPWHPSVQRLGQEPRSG